MAVYVVSVKVEVVAASAPSTALMLSSLTTMLSSRLDRLELALVVVVCFVDVVGEASAAVTAQRTQGGTPPFAAHREVIQGGGP